MGMVEEVGGKENWDNIVVLGASKLGTAGKSLPRPNEDGVQSMICLVLYVWDRVVDRLRLTLNSFKINYIHKIVSRDTY